MESFADKSSPITHSQEANSRFGFWDLQKGFTKIPLPSTNPGPGQSSESPVCRFRLWPNNLPQWIKEIFGWSLNIMKRTDRQAGFVVLPKRWVVERTFAWLSRCRWHSKDYSQNPE